MTSNDTASASADGPNRRTVLKTIGATTGSLVAVSGASTSAAAAGSYTRHSYGGLGYTKYVPDGVDDGTAVPLVVMLHGCTQTADQFRDETEMNRQADDHGFIVLYPEQSTSRHYNRCWQWFNDENTTRNSGEVAIIKGMVDEVKADHNVDPASVYAAGFSAGAAMVPNLIVAYADVFSAGAVHSGLEYDAVESETEGVLAMSQCNAKDPQQAGTDAYQAMRDANAVSNQKVMVWHGSDDTTVYPCNGRDEAERATQTYDLTDDGSDDDSVDYSADETTSDCSTGHCVEVYEYWDANDESVVEYWEVQGMQHAWSGGASGGEYTDPDAPDASEYIWNWFAGDDQDNGDGDDNAAPTANAQASPSSVDPGEEITFDGSNSSDGDGAIESYEWDLDDGTTKTGETVTHAYDDAGDYRPRLTVTDDDGATGSDTDVVEVTDDSFDGYCGKADNYTHVQEDRAWTDGSYAYANGSDQKLGLYNLYEESRIEEKEDNYYEVVQMC